MPCGTWFGHRVRMSALFLVVPVILGMQVWNLRLALLVGLFLMAAVLIHEIALLCAIRLSGGEVRELFLWPLGGVPRMGSTSIPPAPVASVIAALVSAAVAVMCLPALMRAETIDWSILNPLVLPVEEVAGNIEYDMLALFFFANWLVLLVNLIPAQPLDGGRVVETMVISRTGTTMGKQIVTRVGMAVGLVMIFSALLLQSVWLCALGALLAGYNLRESMRHQSAENFDDSFMGYDFSQGYTSLERSNASESESSPSLIKRWMERRKARREVRLREKAERAERDLDALLAKVHNYGIDSLTDSERRTLRRVSARYRGRSGS